MKWLVDYGYAVASISYRYSQEAIFPAQIHDCKAAVRWLRANAQKFGYNSSCIGVVGVSAGGQLALLMGANTQTSGHDGTLGTHLDQPTYVSAVVSFHGASDFILRAKTQPRRSNLPGSVVHQLLGGAPEDDEDRARLASAAFHISNASAPLLAIHGTADTTVLPDQSERILEVYRTHDLPAELLLIPDGTHRLADVHTKETKAEVLKFLNTHLNQSNSDLTGSTAISSEGL